MRSSAAAPWTQVGIISSTVCRFSFAIERFSRLSYLFILDTECYDVDNPVYYTRVTSYASWIAERKPF